MKRLLKAIGIVLGALAVIALGLIGLAFFMKHYPALFLYSFIALVFSAFVAIVYEELD